MASVAEPTAGTWRIGPAAGSRLRARPRSAAPGSRGARAGGWRASSPACRRGAQTTTVRGLKSRPVFGSVKPNWSKSQKRTFASARPRNRPDDRGEEAHDERLEEHRAQHLPARRAERAQRRELARPLRDRDRERVRDHERADEERNDPEREEERLQEAGEGVRVAGVRLGLRAAAPHLCLRREDRPDRGEQRRPR